MTSVARTLVDLASSGHFWLIERALDDAIVRGTCRLADVVAAADRAGIRHGRVGIRRLVADRRDDRVDSHQEIRWIKVIRSATGMEVELHHRFKTSDGIFEIDIAIPERKVGFEVNGWSSHGTRSAFDQDARKGLALLAEGWHIATLTSNMSEDAVMTAVHALLARYGKSVGKLRGL